MCERCGSVFEPRDGWEAKRVKYCSKSCADKASVGRVVSRQTLECEECGSPFEDIRYRIERGRRYCSHGCASKAKDEGRTTLQRKFREKEKNVGWARNVMKRDDFTCQQCGERDGNLQVHHVVPVAEIIQLVEGGDVTTHPLFADIGNGQTLCEQCHSQRHE